MRMPGLLLAVMLAMVVAAGSVQARPSAAPSKPATSAHSCTDKDELWFRSSDGTKLVGHRFGGKTPGRRTAVVLAHMSEGDLCSWAPYARRLASEGLFAFPFDFRGYGFSEGNRDFGRAAADVTAAVRAVRRLGARKVVVVGASLGGIAALVAAPRLRPALQGVVSVSGPAVIAGEIDARSSVTRLRAPTLFVVAQDDQSSPYDFAAEARLLYEATATRKKRLDVVAGSLHGTFLVDGSPAVRRALTAFLRDPASTVP